MVPISAGPQKYIFSIHMGNKPAQHDLSQRLTVNKFEKHCRKAERNMEGRWLEGGG